MRLPRLAVFCLVLLITASCKNIFGPKNFEKDLNWNIRERQHFIFYVRSNSFAEQNIDTLIQILESHYAYVLNTLELNYSGIISVYIYNSPEDIGTEYCGGSAYPRTETVKVVCSPICGGVSTAAPHEIVHVIAKNALGEPGTFFLNEGLAVALEETRLGMHLHDWTKKFIEEKRLPSLNTLIDNSRWFDIAYEISYPVSGSFVNYLINMYGAYNIKELFYRANSSNFLKEFQDIYGKSLEGVEAEWKTYCLNW